MPVLILTKSGSNLFLRSGNESRRPGFLTKPVEPEQLLRVVNRVLIDATNHFLEQQRLFELCKVRGVDAT